MLVLLVTPLALVAASAREPSWIPVGPTGGSVRALVADPSTPNRLYLGTPDGVLYRSDDQGRNWKRLDPGFPRRGCSLDAVVVDTQGVLYVGFWEVAGRGGGIARSTDGGVTLELLKGMAGQSVRALAVAPSNPRTIAAGALGGVFLSEDAGTSWRRISPEGCANLRNVASLAFDPADPRILYAGTWHLAWKTTDAGATWAPAQRGMVDDSHVMTLTVDRHDPRDLFATACTGIYHSADGGSQWTKLEGIPESSRRTRSFCRSPRDADLLLAGTTEGLWISGDRGRSWRLVTGKDLVVNALLLAPDGTILLGTEEEGVLRSSDRGKTWIASNAGFTERFVSRLLFDRAQGRVIAAVWDARPKGALYVASDVRGPWTRFGQGLEGRHVLSLATLDHTVFAGTDAGLFARTPDAGAWAPLASRIGRAPLPRLTELVALERGRLLAATSGGLVLSKDRGKTWAPVGPSGTGEVYALTASPVDPGVVLAATPEGFFRSRDGGEGWQQISSPLHGVIPHALAFVPDDDRVVLATTSGGLLRSGDRGATWKWVGGGIPRCDLTGLAVTPDGSTILVSDFTRGGVFRSADGGASWSRMTTRGLVSDRVWTLELDPGDPEQLLAASPAGGLCLLVPSSASSVEAASSPGSSPLMAAPAGNAP